MPEYPGWQRNLRHVLQPDIEAENFRETGVFPMGIHHRCYGCESEILTVREVAMLLVMEQLTEKADWHVKVFDQTIVDKWIEEALAWPNEDLWKRTSNFPPHYFHDEWLRYLPPIPENILDRPSVEFVMQELHQKAEYFQRTGIIPSLDASHSVAKSDALVDQDLRLALRSAFDRLKADQEHRPDWHPNTNGIVQDLVHPSMYPLVYGCSLFLPDEVVGVDDAVEKWAGKGEPISKLLPAEDNQNTRSRDIPPHYWSETYQWLPANLKFTDEGGVKFTSYVNNLHPSRREVYRAIERLVDVAIPLWDQCLRRHSGSRYRYMRPVQRDGAGRVKPRIEPENPESVFHPLLTVGGPPANLPLQRRSPRKLAPLLGRL